MELSPQSKSSSGKCYTEAFKKEALALIAAGRGRVQVSRELGVSVWALSRWQQRAAGTRAVLSAQSPADPGTAALAAENALLRKQPAKAELHAVILKKALAIVGREPAEDLK